MWRGRVATAMLAVSLSMPALVSCTHNQAAGQLVPENAVTVHVTNQNYNDMDVYLVADGLATRLGTVTGNQQQTFMLDPSVISQDLRLVATPIGGNGRATSGRIIVAAGQTINFRIAPLLQNSTTFIR